jgi:hypothetical protein
VQQGVAPAERLKEVRAKIADVERVIELQVANLEAENTSRALDVGSFIRSPGSETFAGSRRGLGAMSRWRTRHR